MKTLLALALLLVSSSPLLGQKAKAPEPAPSPTPAPIPIARAWTAEEILEEARRVEQHADNELTQISGLMENFIAVLGVVILVLLGLALQEWRVVREKMKQEISRAKKEADAVNKAKNDAEATLRQIQQTAEQHLKAAEEARTKADTALRQANETAERLLNGAEEARTKADASLYQAQGLVTAIEEDRSKVEATTRLASSALKEAQESSEMIAAMQQKMRSAWGELGPELKKLPAVEADWIVGGEDPRLAPDLKATLEDYDVLLIVYDRLGLGIEEAPEKTFLRFAQYWRIARKFPRALKRGERAIELAPKNDPEVRFQLGITLSHWAAYEREERTPERKERLQRALSIFEEVRVLQGRDTADLLFEMAWTLDEMDRSEESIDLARRACATIEADPHQELQQEPWEYPYNLACYLAKAGRFEEVLAELRKLVGQGPKWANSATEDRDFDRLRESSAWRVPFEQLLEEGRREA